MTIPPFPFIGTSVRIGFLMPQLDPELPGQALADFDPFFFCLTLADHSRFQRLLNPSLMVLELKFQMLAPDNVIHLLMHLTYGLTGFLMGNLTRLQSLMNFELGLPHSFVGLAGNLIPTMHAALDPLIFLVRLPSAHFAFTDGSLDPPLDHLPLALTAFLFLTLMKLAQFLASLLVRNLSRLDRFMDPALSLAQFMVWVFLLSLIPPELTLDLPQFPTRFRTGNSSFAHGLLDFAFRMAVTLHERVLVANPLILGLQKG